MEGTDSYTKPQKPVQVLSGQSPENQIKFYYHFLYKAAIVTVFLIILPLFPSQAPDFLNQTLVTQSWELLHLLFVGIAISYGLFSRRSNDDAHKENDNNSNSSSKFDNAQSYVSRFLQVSSVFDDESENPSGSDENKVQTWSSQYYRNEPVVVVAQENSVLDDNDDGHGRKSSRTGERPLLLPVRSLKSRIPEQTDMADSVKENGAVSGSVSRSNSKTGSRRYSSNLNRGLDHQEVEEKLKESVVLPSPIPWRSRSGRMEMKEDVESASPPSMAEPEFNRIDSRAPRPQTSRSPRPNSSNSLPRLSPSPSLSSVKKSSPSPSESQAKITEDMVKRKSFNKSSSIPPPPPPPPPPVFDRGSTMKPSSGFSDHGGVSKDMRRSFMSEPNDAKRSRFDGLSMAKSVRTSRAENNVISHEFPHEEEEEEEVDLVGKMLMEFDQEETESEDDEVGAGAGSFDQNDVGEESPKQSVENNEEKTTAAAANNGGDGGPDVDKKADEFIAKFREQIRLQRIESIKRSSAQMSRKLAK